MATIYGTVDEDVLSGEESLGGDVLSGLAGDDLYYSDTNKDKVVESANGGIDKIVLGQMFDFAGLSSYTMANNVEDLDISNISLNDMLHDPVNLEKFVTNGVTVYGNASNNTIYGNLDYGSYIKIMGGDGNDTILNDLSTAEANDYFDGGAGHDTLRGGLGYNTLIGGLGNDLLVSAASTDILDGGAGDDTYSIVPTEGVFGGPSLIPSITDSAGIDTIKVEAYEGTEIDLRTIANGQIENVDASLGTVAPGSFTISGTSVANTLIGKGNDTNIIYGYGGNDRLIGGEYGDTLYGGDGDDYLDDNSNASAGTLVGGEGNDTYILDAVAVEALDTITELNGYAGGIDTLKVINGYAFSGTVDLADYANIENLDASSHTEGSLTLYGSSANNTLTATSGNDFLQGNGGVDTLIGGAGRDTYYLTNRAEVIVEADIERASAITMDFVGGDKVAVAD